MWGYCLITSNRSDDFSRSTSVSAVAKTDALRGPPTRRDISPKNSPSPSSSRTTSCPSISLITLPPPRLIKYIASPSSPSAIMRSPAMNCSGSSLSTMAPNSSSLKAANRGLMSFFTSSCSDPITSTSGSISKTGSGSSAGGGATLGAGGGATLGAGGGATLSAGGGTTSTGGGGGGGGAASAASGDGAAGVGDGAGSSGARNGGGTSAAATAGLELMARINCWACFSSGANRRIILYVAIPFTEKPESTNSLAAR